MEQVFIRVFDYNQNLFYMVALITLFLLAFVFGCLSVCGKLGIHFGANSFLFKTDEDISEMNKSLESILKTLET